MDPTLWCAYERLCKLQMNNDPSKFFTDNHQAIIRMNGMIKEHIMIPTQNSPTNNAKSSPPSSMQPKGSPQ